MRKTFLALPLALLIFSAAGRAADDAQGLFKEKCAACHGPDGTAKTPAGKAMKVPDLTAPEMKKESDEAFSDAIQKGKGKMPAMKSLSGAQVKELVEYCRRLGKS
ncbi:MAG TPA: cytochrome c [Bryobacteraceae bacterium]|nr:cytochrome c [Bryobacteraceae bacterium]